MILGSYSYIISFDHIMHHQARVIVPDCSTRYPLSSPFICSLTLQRPCHFSKSDKGALKHLYRLVMIKDTPRPHAALMFIIGVAQ